MLLESALAGLGGGVLRLAPEVLKFFDRKNERQHELSMLDRQVELEKSKAEHEIKLKEEEHDSNIDAGLVNTLLESIKGQMTKSGVAWVDALNISVRPIVTYLLLGLYSIVKFVLVYLAVSNTAGFNPDVLKIIYTEADAAMLWSVLGFWFVNRSLEKRL